MSRLTFDWTDWAPRERAVLVLVWDRAADSVLLIRKKRGLGQGKVNFPGGRLEPGEDWAAAARRETQEEVGLTVGRLEECAEHRFQFADGYGLLVKAFLSPEWAGEPVATAEADPFWCPRLSIPYSEMWSDDPIWVPRVFEGHYVTARWFFDRDRMLGARVEWDWRPS